MTSGVFKQNNSIFQETPIMGQETDDSVLVSFQIQVDFGLWSHEALIIKQPTVQQYTQAQVLMWGYHWWLFSPLTASWASDSHFSPFLKLSHSSFRHTRNISCILWPYLMNSSQATRQSHDFGKTTLFAFAEVTVWKTITRLIWPHPFCLASVLTVMSFPPVCNMNKKS